jgi:hypothetical protein
MKDLEIKKKYKLSNTNLNNLSNVVPLYRTKTEFQKKLMNENNMVKYKNMCIGIIKDNDEIKRMCDICNIGITNVLLENFLEDCCFSDKIFLYKLENLLKSDINLNKQKKEKFFREEIKKIIELKTLDIQYTNKINKLYLSIDNHIQNIQTFEFFK